MLGFVAASVLATWYLTTVSVAHGKEIIGAANDLRTWFLILAFVSIGLEFRVSSLREAGWRPIGVFAGARISTCWSHSPWQSRCSRGSPGPDSGVSPRCEVRVGSSTLFPTKPVSYY
ncbi:putative sulfate exporter family transporter [Nonomuraea sp. 3N208]|uniref:putative sulfate exporter family transporter n=1 Tax=Nonomuraea sp. 3N208 TaxID=3457421 RepID=UPI003FD5C662